MRSTNYLKPSNFTSKLRISISAGKLVQLRQPPSSIINKSKSSSALSVQKCELPPLNTPNLIKNRTNLTPSESDSQKDYLTLTTKQIDVCVEDVGDRITYLMQDRPIILKKKTKTYKFSRQHSLQESPNKSTVSKQSVDFGVQTNFIKNRARQTQTDQAQSTIETQTQFETECAATQTERNVKVILKGKHQQTQTQLDDFIASGIEDLKTIVAVANACSVDLRAEIPLFYDQAKVEVMTLEHFQFCIKKMQMTKFTQELRFQKIVEGLRHQGCIYTSGIVELIHAEKFNNLLKLMSYEYAGVELRPEFHGCNQQAHRVMNRLLEYCQQQGQKEKFLRQLLPWVQTNRKEFWDTLKRVGVRKSTYEITLPITLTKEGINRENLADVLELYQTNPYLISFGTHKVYLPATECLKMGENIKSSIMARLRKTTVVME